MHIQMYEMVNGMLRLVVKCPVNKRIATPPYEYRQNNGQTARQTTCRMIKADGQKANVIAEATDEQWIGDSC